MRALLVDPAKQTVTETVARDRHDIYELLECLPDTTDLFEISPGICLQVFTDHENCFFRSRFCGEPRWCCAHDDEVYEFAGICLVTAYDKRTYKPVPVPMNAEEFKALIVYGSPFRRTNRK